MATTLSVIYILYCVCGCVYIIWRDSQKILIVIYSNENRELKITLVIIVYVLNCEKNRKFLKRQFNATECVEVSLCLNVSVCACPPKDIA